MSELVVKSSIIWSERRGAVYKEGDEIVLYIPPSYAILDTKNSYISLRLKVSGELKACPSAVAGAYSLWRDCTITDGTGQYVLESLSQYAQLQSIYNFYSETESKKNLRVLHEGHPMRNVINDTLGNQYVDASASDDSCFTEVECLLPLHLSGCLSPDRDTVFPNVATSGLRIRLVLNDAQTALNVMTAPIFDTAGNEMEATTNGSFPTLGGGGYDSGHGYEAQAQAAAAATQIVLKCQGEDTPSVDGRVLSPNVAKPAHLFKVGQTLQLNGDADNQVTVTSVSVAQNAPYRLTLGVSALPKQLNAGQSVHILHDTTHATPNFEVSDFSFVTSYVVPPKGYLEKIMGSLGKGLTMDIRTYQLYQTNISGGAMNNSLYINARNNRAKSILSIPYKASANSVQQDSMIPDREQIKDYQYILYKILTPDRKVPCDRFNNQAFNAEALREMDLALSSADIPVENLFKNYQMFFIGRRLATAGYSYNCNRPDEGEIRLNINYSSAPSSSGVLVHNYLVHLRQIQISPSGIKIVY